MVPHQLVLQSLYRKEYTFVLLLLGNLLLPLAIMPVEHTFRPCVHGFQLWSLKFLAIYQISHTHLLCWCLPTCLLDKPHLQPIEGWGCLVHITRSYNYIISKPLIRINIIVKPYCCLRTVLFLELIIMWTSKLVHNAHVDPSSYCITSTVFC